MDFTPTEEQTAARELAARIFGDLSTHERLAAAGTGTDAGLWKELCAAGLPAAVEETGLLGLVLLLEEQGRTTAQVPLAATCVYGLLAVAAHGTREQRARLLPAIGAGTVVVTGAFPARGAIRADAPATPTGVARSGTPVGAGSAADSTRTGPAVTPARTELGGDLPRTGPAAEPVGIAPTAKLTGIAPVVPWLRDAAWVLVPDVERGLWLVSTSDATVAVEPVETTAPWSAGRLTLTGTPGERLGGPGPEAYEQVLAASRTAFAGLQAGVCAGSLARAVAHTATREQFGRPLATNQGVLLRAADAYMDTEAIRVTAYEAAWRHDVGLPFAAQALTAAWWASEAGQRVVHAGQHLHGGTGADLEHPVHRHFLWGRQLDAYLGCGSEVLAELGKLLAGTGSEPGADTAPRSETATAPAAAPGSEAAQGPAAAPEAGTAQGPAAAPVPEAATATAAATASTPAPAPEAATAPGPAAAPAPAPDVSAAPTPPPEPATHPAPDAATAPAPEPGPLGQDEEPV